jgi:hypothetical protein
MNQASNKERHDALCNGRSAGVNRPRVATLVGACLFVLSATASKRVCRLNTDPSPPRIAHREGGRRPDEGAMCGEF